VVPRDVEVLIEEVSVAARSSELVDQSSGVSARVAIAATELLHSNLERRALRTGDDPVWPRLVDLHMLLPAITGKVEMVYEGEQQGAEIVARSLLGTAVKKVFAGRFPKPPREGAEAEGSAYAPLLAWFADGNTVTLSDESRFADHLAALRQVPGLWALAEPAGGSEEERAFTAELILDGLYQHARLARHDVDSTISYKEAVRLQVLRRPARRESVDDAN
jgi:magnesium chelatase subunit I